ncbi:uncharacterized protein LOC109012526 [Juglans regia]|uniref:Uncharacterized protein LOC109012526 n=1 Tax=Juglans regia TaxID=51240 RepID=A0A6P9EHB8_JUGRE|nr:uncharacterized protein LOC109012526 [Juglans regia]
MTEKKVVLICIVVGLLGLLSAATAFVAELKRIKGSQVEITQYQCLYPSSPAITLASTAALALLIARLIITFATRCGCCHGSTHPSKSTSTVARFLCFFAWITFVIGFTILLAAAAVSNKHDIETTYSGNYIVYSCPVVRHGVFAAGAVLSLVSSILGIIYFILISANQGDIPSDNPKQGEQGGIAIGEPQFPQKNNNAQELV